MRPLLTRIALRLLGAQPKSRSEPSALRRKAHTMTAWRCITVLVVSVFATTTLVGAARPARSTHGPADVVTPGSPNILFILTDDQRFDSLFAMRNVQRMIAEPGITFTNAFVSNSVCCPSRAAILTGGYSHTTGVWTNEFSDAYPYGAWPAFHIHGDESSTLATWLHDAGYRTGLVGKYFNQFPGGTVPPGWDFWASFAREGDGGGYYDYSWYSRDQGAQHFGTRPSDYSTRVIGRQAMRFLGSTTMDQPFFLYVAPYAPHGPMTPDSRDVGSFASYTQTLRPDSGERDVADKPRYIRRPSHVGTGRIEDFFHRQYETLQAVDRMVGRLIGYLARTGQLRDTIVVFMSDNGRLFGEHRWSDKLVPYEEAIRVPLVIRYDRLTRPYAGTMNPAMVANIDIAPTLAELAGVTALGVNGVVDGTSFDSALSGAQTGRSALLLEHVDFRYHVHVPTYCGLRTSDGWTYVRYSTGEEELYELRTDPYQLQNIAVDDPAKLRALRRETRPLCAPPGYSW